uniref:Uncharacterized protein n=1 Tax=Hemiselmis andersenii TaxID=464988 RepID=A0A6U4LXT3_HEMAN|mmetsp:Transcript_37390/g.87596  ORF Transcript_37390/g.87596 Transcript_37390/m.87596 type:complete len:157 (-) Transcript_37390:462-932(-)
MRGEGQGGVKVSSRMHPATGRGWLPPRLSTWAVVLLGLVWGSTSVVGSTVVPGGLAPNAMPLVGGIWRQPFKLSRCGESSVLDVCQMYPLWGFIAGTAMDRRASALRMKLEDLSESAALSARDATDVPRVRSVLQRTTDVSSCERCEHCTSKVRLC